MKAGFLESTTDGTAQPHINSSWSSIVMWCWVHDQGISGE